MQRPAMTRFAQTSHEHNIDIFNIITMFIIFIPLFDVSTFIG